MKRNRFFWIGLAVAALILGGTVTESPAGSDETIPSYYSHLDFNLTSPGALATPVGGFANPAVYRMMPGNELWYYWSDQGARLRSIPRWGLFMGGPHLGIGAVYNRFGSPLTGNAASVTDYRLSLALGDKTTSLGLGFGWSSGDEELAGRTRIIQTGALHRFGRYASLGPVGTFSLQNRNRSGLADLAVRPLGDRLLTLFADAEVQRKTRLDDVIWSAGAMVEPLPGLQLTGRYFEDESFAVSVAFSFGKMGAAASPRFDKENDLNRTLYGVRLGYDEPNVFDTYLEEGSSYLSLHLTGRVRYRKYRFFDKKTFTLSGILGSLESARKDPRVRGVALNLSGTHISRGKAWEISEKLKELRKEGKHVVVYVDDAGMTLYHIASAADRIVMDPTGILMLPGYVMGRTFVSHLMEKLGLGFDEWRFFKYKSAFEMFSRDKMSNADREQRLELIEGYYNEIKNDVVAARGVSGSDFDRWINEEMVFMPEAAFAMGLIDKLGKWEDVKHVIEELEGSKKRFIPPSKLSDRVFPSTLWGENPQIAVVYGLGECAMDTGIHARLLEKIFHRLRDDRRVKAVVFRVDSPGGDGMASDIVAEALSGCAKKKPVIVSQGDVAGSGGYWISMYGTEILALPTTITGSVGVIGGWVWNDGIGEKMGLTSDHVQVGEHADLGFGILLPLLGMGIPDRNLTEEERGKVEDLLLEFYDEFVGKVATGRNMDKEAVQEIAQGRVWTGRAGVSNGLIDRVGGLELALRLAQDKAGIEPGAAVDVVEYPPAPLINLAALGGGPRPLRGLLGWIRGEEDISISSEDEDYFDNYEWKYLQAVTRSKGRPVFMVPPEVLPIEKGLFGE